MDKGKGKMIEPEKPKKAVPFPLQIGGAFKIYEKAHVPLASPVAQPVKREKKKSVAGPPRVAKVLKLVDDEEDLEAGQPIEAVSGPVPKVLAPIEELKVKVIEAPLVRKRTLKKVAGAIAREVDPTIPVVEVVSVANFLPAQRKQVPPPSVQLMVDVEAFLANELVEAIPVNTVKSVAEEPIQAPGSPIPSILNHHLGSNIQHILEDIDMDSEEL